MKWKCVKVFNDAPGFTEGRTYTTSSTGRLLDDDMRVRVKPEVYNSAGISYLFKPLKEITQMENK